MVSYYYLQDAVKEEPVKEKRNSMLKSRTFKSVCDWLVCEITKVDPTVDKETLENFKKEIKLFLKNSFETLHCANLRTTKPDSNLYCIASKVGLDQNLLPKNISLIVNSEKAYFFRKESSFKHYIVK